MWFRTNVHTFMHHKIIDTDKHISYFSMRNSAACGTDGICIRIFKHSFSAIGPVILHIVNHSLTQKFWFLERKKSALPAMIGDMEATLESLDLYFRSNSLKVNETKFELLPHGTRQNLRNLPSFTVKFHESRLAPCDEATNIGLTFDKYLSWDSL